MIDFGDGREERMDAWEAGESLRWKRITAPLADDNEPAIASGEELSGD